jgi:hypothetical protein
VVRYFPVVICFGSCGCIAWWQHLAPVFQFGFMFLPCSVLLTHYTTIMQLTFLSMDEAEVESVKSNLLRTLGVAE